MELLVSKFLRSSFFGCCKCKGSFAVISIPNPTFFGVWKVAFFSAPPNLFQKKDFFMIFFKRYSIELSQLHSVWSHCFNAACFEPKALTYASEGHETYTPWFNVPECRLVSPKKCERAPKLRETEARVHVRWMKAASGCERPGTASEKSSVRFSAKRTRWWRGFQVG